MIKKPIKKNDTSVKERFKWFFEKGGRKLSETVKSHLPPVDGKRLLMMNIPYVIVFYLIDKVAWLYRYCIGDSLIEKLGVLFLNFHLHFLSDRYDDAFIIKTAAVAESNFIASAQPQ